MFVLVFNTKNLLANCVLVYIFFVQVALKQKLDSVVNLVLLLLE